MNRRTAPLASLILAFAVPALPATILDFEDVAHGTVLTNQYAAQGVIFDGHFSVFSGYFGGALNVVSGDNWVDVGIEYQVVELNFVDPTDGHARLATGVSFVSHGVTAPAWLDGYYFSGFDLSGTLVQGDFIPGGNGDLDRTNLGYEFVVPITKLQFYRVQSPYGEPGAAPLDRLTFDLVPETPEPGTFVLPGGAAIALGALRRVKAHRA